MKKEDNWEAIPKATLVKQGTPVRTMLLFLIQGVDSWSSKLTGYFSDKLRRGKSETLMRCYLQKSLPHHLKFYI